MMKYGFWFSLILAGCIHPSTVVQNNCTPPVQALSLPIETLAPAILGVWDYQYSYKNDTCFQIAHLGDLPQQMAFRLADQDSIQQAYPKLFSFGKDKLLFGLSSSHENNSFGDHTYPLVNTIHRDSHSMQITHYVPGNGIGKSFSYFLEGLVNDTLVLRNERQYLIGTEKWSGVRHVFYREEVK